MAIASLSAAAAVGAKYEGDPRTSDPRASDLVASQLDNSESNRPNLSART